jgi:hypothetical protein
MTAVSTPPRAGSNGLSAESRRSTSGIRAVAWKPNENIEYDKWVLEGRRIGAMGRGSPWWMGDWLLYGEGRWGEKYTEAVRITGYDKKSLRNMRYVASRFELSLRRDSLHWSHHALLAAFELDEQKYWLDRAVADRLSVDDLRIELRSAQRGGYSAADDDREPDQSDGQAPSMVCPHCGKTIPPALLGGGNS